MSSLNIDHNKPPTLRQLERFWKDSSKGQFIIKFLSSLDDTGIEKNNTLRNNLQPRKLPEHDLEHELEHVPEHHPGDRFMDAGNDYLLDIDFTNEVTNRSEQELLPDPDHRSNAQDMIMEFISFFCLKEVFRSTYEDSKFDLALTALDFLQYLHCARRDVLREATKGLGITQENWRHALADNQPALIWVNHIDHWNKSLEDCYSGLYVGIRIWIMVYKLHTTYFVKGEALAMLNTLFPPSVQQLPQMVSLRRFHIVRSIFYQHLVLIEAKGVRVLDPFIKSLEMPSNIYTWKKVRKFVSDYIKYSEAMIEVTKEGFGCLRTCDPRRLTFPHSEGHIRISQQSGSLPVETAWMRSSYYPIILKHPTPLVSMISMNSIQDSVIAPTILHSNEYLETRRRDKSSLMTQRRVLQDQRVTALSARLITSDDMILPGSPFLPDTSEGMNNYKLRDYGDRSTNSSVFQRTPRLSKSSRPNQPYASPDSEPERPVLNPKPSFTKLLRKKFSIGSLSTPRTPRGTSASETGLDISMDASKSVENFPEFDPNFNGSGRSILRNQPGASYLNDTNTTVGSQSSKVCSLQSMDSRADTSRCESIEPSILADSQTALKIKKKRSLPAFFTRKKSSPALRDSGLDDDQEQHAPLSELQPIQSTPSRLSKSTNRLWKAKSCNTLKSIANSQTTGNPTAHSPQSIHDSELTETRLIDILTAATGSQTSINSSTPQWMAPRRTRKKLEPGGNEDPPAILIPHPRSKKAQRGLKFNWNRDSEDWKSREHTREYLLRQHRAKRENNPYYQRNHVAYPTAPSLHTAESNAQETEGIIPSRDTSKTPTEKTPRQRKYTMIDINKYVKRQGSS